MFLHAPWDAFSEDDLTYMAMFLQSSPPHPSLFAQQLLIDQLRH